MKAKVACLVVAILATIGCAPSNAPQPDSAGSKSSNEHPSIEQKTQLASIDPPNCDSEETRKIAQEVVLKKPKGGRIGEVDFSSQKVCLISNGNSMRAEDRFAVFNDECELFIERNLYMWDFIEDFPIKDFAKNYDIKKHLVVFNDATFSIHSYVVKKENRAIDGNSNSCSLMITRKISSQSAGLSYVGKPVSIELALYKLDQNGERPYEYRF